MKRILPTLTLFSLLASAHAEVALPKIFSDHMVLQRDQPIPIWGTANANEKVTVQFSGQQKEANADADGKWMVKLDALPANAQPAELKVNDRVFKNVLVGEVWLCSGQSNMEWTAGNIKNAEAVRANALNPLLRHIKVDHRPSDVLETDIPRGNWQECTPDTLPSFTAVGYFFALELHKKLNVPIGLINSSWGGTKIEPWTTAQGFQHISDQPFATQILKVLDEEDPASDTGKAKFLKAIEQHKAWVKQAETKIAAGKYPPNMPNAGILNRSHQDPTRLYNGMIHPLVPYAIRGAIWYQGESNGGEGETYTHKTDALINGWRNVWNQGDFPFYFVQLANFQPDQETPEGGYGFARIREAQRAALKIKNTGMAVIIDIGETSDIHPRNKQDVGYRLAQWALNRDYGKNEVVPSGPLYASHKMEGNKIRLTFEHTGSGLMVGEKVELDPVNEITDGSLKRFSIAGEDRKWVWANAVIEGNEIIVSSAEVAAPVAVRYAYSGNPEGANLYNRDGLPASPFRTDDW